MTRNCPLMGLLFALGGLGHALGDYCNYGDCTSCLRAPRVNRSNGCAWCYSLQQCLDVKSMDTSKCPAYVTEPDVCRCQPGTLLDCHGCVSRPGCVWVEKGVINSTSTNLGFSFTSTRSWDGVCWTGGIFGGPSNLKDVLLTDTTKIMSSRRSISWSWGQCGLRNGAFARLVVFLVIFGLVGMFLLVRVFSTPGPQVYGNYAQQY